VWERLQDHYLKKSLANRLILKQCLFLLSMHKGIPIKSHILEFFSVINDLDRIDVKIEDEVKHFITVFFIFFIQELWKAIIYEGKKSTIKVNEVKEHLLNKDKTDNQ